MKGLYYLMLFCMSLFFVACQSKEKPRPDIGSPASTTAEKPAASQNSRKLSAQTYRGLKVQPINFKGKTFMGIRQKVPFAKIQPFYAANLNKIFTACQAYGLQMDGMPSGLFYEYNEEAGYADMAATISVVSGKEVGDGIQMINLPAAKALQIDYYGEYVGLAEAHYAMEDYLNSNKLSQNKAIPVIEEYITDPGEQPDPKKRLTRLTYFHR